jgi:hypothetical protein
VARNISDIIASFKSGGRFLDRHAVEQSLHTLGAMLLR